MQIIEQIRLNYFFMTFTLIGGYFGIAGCVAEGGVFNESVYADTTAELPANFDDLDSLFLLGTYQQSRSSADNVNNIRRQAIQEAASTIGAQGGLAARAEQINHELQANDADLDRIFNFNTLLLESNVVPPVIVEGQSTLNLDDPDTIRIVNRTFKIVKQAHFVTTPPNWRQYLWLDFSQPQIPHASLLPQNLSERKIWNEYVAKGWENGDTQANLIFAENLSRLKEDYIGMLTYNRLLAQNMVSAPFVANADLGVTGDSNQINIDDRILRITAHPGLTTDNTLWDPAVSNFDDILEIDERLENIIGDAESINISDENSDSDDESLDRDAQ